MRSYENRYFVFDGAYERNAVYPLKCIVRAVRACDYRLSLLLAKRRNDQDKKYNVCICSIFKDEAENLREWLEYHRIVGVEHFYMYNNDSTDDYLSVIKPYMDDGIVTLIDWPGRQMQIRAYEDAIQRFKDETKWMGFIDIDEFVVPLKEATVYGFLEKFNRKASAVLIYWKVFGTSGMLTRDPSKLVTEQFTQSYQKMTEVGKCFFNTSFEYAFGVAKNDIMHHLLWCKMNGRLIPPVNSQGYMAFPGHHIRGRKEFEIQINHYVTKSYQDYYHKANVKTDVFFDKNPRSMDKLFSIEQRCTDRDYRIFRFMSKLKVNMRQRLTSAD